MVQICPPPTNPPTHTIHHYTNDSRAGGALQPGPPSPVKNVPVEVSLFLIDDTAPQEEEVKWDVWCLQRHQSGGLSEMRLENLWEWMENVTQEEALDIVNR